MDDTELLITLPENQQTQSIDLGISLPEAAPEILMTPNICVIGVGGAGGNAINNMIESKLASARFVVANTDAQVMAKSLTRERIQLGATITQGLGAGSNPEIGKAAAEESKDKIKEALQGVNLLFVAAGMGGGTGTGASPVIAKIAKEMGILTVAVVTKPFRMEGPKRMRVAEAGIEELTKNVDTILTIPNQNLFLIANAKTTIKEAFKMADNILYQAVKSITDLMITTMDIHVDFADFRAITKGMGKAIMGSGEAEGENRALEATEKAIVNPLLDISMQGAKGVLISLSGKDISLMEAEEATERVRQEVDEDANIIFGICADENMGDKIRVSVVATGLNKEKEIKAPETRHLLQEAQPAVMIVPAGGDEKLNAQQEKPEPVAIFVPAPKGEDMHPAPSEKPILLSEEITTIRTDLADTFIPTLPSEMPLDEAELEASVNDNTPELFATVIKDLDTKNDSLPSAAASPDEVGGGVAKKKKESFWNEILPGIWSEKKLVEKSKKRLQNDENAGLERTIPQLPSEEELGIPAFFTNKDKIV